MEANLIRFSAEGMHSALYETRKLPVFAFRSMPVTIPVASRRDVKADAISSSRKIRLRNLIRPGMKLVTIPIRNPP